MRRQTMQEWAVVTYGPDWRRLGPTPMEGWAQLHFGPAWRARLKRTVTGYKSSPNVTLTVDAVMADCRDWFLAHTPGEGWKNRVVVNSGMGTDSMRAAQRRIERGDWEFCAYCRLPVYQNEREPLPGGRARHPFCDAPEPGTSVTLEPRKEPTMNQLPMEAA